MKPVVYIAGARPNFMKVAPILRAAQGTPLDGPLVHTGQHYDFAMSGVFFEQLRMKQPDVHLNVGSSSHGVQTGRIMAEFEQYLLSGGGAGGIVVVGDVNSTMACALVGAKLGIPVAHVEAGLRSFDRSMPEEINRVVTDAVADVLLVSEPAGLENLAKEGVPASRIDYVGNVMIDSLVDQLPAARALGMAAQIGVTHRGFALVTIHRPSNVDALERLAPIVDFLEQVAATIPVVFPVHPRTEKQLRAFGLYDRLEAAGIRMLKPLGYREFIGLLDSAAIAVSDSGGIQEESTYLGVRCVTLRSNTERPVTITSGTNTLVGDDLERALAIVKERGEAKPSTIDGWDGKAAERIVARLRERWG